MGRKPGLGGRSDYGTVIWTEHAQIHWIWQDVPKGAEGSGWHHFEAILVRF